MEDKEKVHGPPAAYCRPAGRRMPDCMGARHSVDRKGISVDAVTCLHV
ncbi:hypothetical protein F7D09_0617 [Bifidobacterium leontopitheci]|uniref:Uncharacterized protein n=1 Tax=Bifidobacterium leontopitheci TaxID=2650774 RepID=A0A6I1GJI6_9BIFI|nr:hypothetical protein F7D09_0617 [Bifidobacterium leontopitheci]